MRETPSFVVPVWDGAGVVKVIGYV